MCMIACDIDNVSVRARDENQGRLQIRCKKLDKNICRGRDRDKESKRRVRRRKLSCVRERERENGIDKESQTISDKNIGYHHGFIWTLTSLVLLGLIGVRAIFRVLGLLDIQSVIRYSEYPGY
jgi:hypothetical protein